MTRCEKRGPARQVLDGRPELSHRRNAAEVGLRLAPDSARVLVDEVALRLRRLGVPGRTPEAERAQHPLVDVLRVRDAALGRNDSPEQAEREVRVVVRARRREREPDLEVLFGRSRALHEHLAHLALQSREMREHAAERRRPVLDPGQVQLEPVVQVEGARVAELHDRGGGEGLRDRANAVLRARSRCHVAVVVGVADRVRPDRLTFAHDGGGNRRQSVGLPLLQQTIELLRHERSIPARAPRR